MRGALSGRVSKGGTLRGSRGDCKRQEGRLPVGVSWDICWGEGHPPLTPQLQDLWLAPILPQNALNPTNPMHSPNSSAKTPWTGPRCPALQTSFWEAQGVTELLCPSLTAGSHMTLPHHQQHRQQGQPIRVTSRLPQALVPHAHVEHVHLERHRS